MGMGAKSLDVSSYSTRRFGERPAHSGCSFEDPGRYVLIYFGLLFVARAVSNLLWLVCSRVGSGVKRQHGHLSHRMRHACTWGARPLPVRACI